MIDIKNSNLIYELEGKTIEKGQMFLHYSF